MEEDPPGRLGRIGYSGHHHCLSGGSLLAGIHSFLKRQIQRPFLSVQRLPIRHVERLRALQHFKLP